MGRLGAVRVAGITAVGLGEAWYPPDVVVELLEDSFIHQTTPTTQAIPTSHLNPDEVEGGLPGCGLGEELR